MSCSLIITKITHIQKILTIANVRHKNKNKLSFLKIRISRLSFLISLKVVRITVFFSQSETRSGRGKRFNPLTLLINFYTHTDAPTHVQGSYSENF